MGTDMFMCDCYYWYLLYGVTITLVRVPPATVAACEKPVYNTKLLHSATTCAVVIATHA